jgi:hypothetical protein
MGDRGDAVLKSGRMLRIGGSKRRVGYQET